MRLFILLLLQLLVFLPITGLAADGGKTTLLKNHKKTEATASQKAAVVNTYGKLPLYFIENRGQVDEKVSFYERGAGHATFFTDKGVVIGLTKSEGKVEKSSHHGDIKDLKATQDRKATTEALSLSFVGSNKKAKIISGDRKTGHVNYFIGNDRSKWRSNISTYGAVTYKDVYKNIDIKFYGNNRQLEHDVIVRPGGDFSKVKFSYKGVQGLKVTKDGGLEVSLKEGKIFEKKPLIYQVIKGKRVVVDGSYIIFKSNEKTFTYGFDVASYDKTKEIVIDPVLVYSTYLGGNANDEGWTIAVDGAGAVYVAGETDSTTFPTVSPIQAVYGGGLADAFVTKINPAGTALVYSTYLGGSFDDYASAIAVDASGNAYITGSTYSTDFPLANPTQGTIGGGVAGFSDAFVTKINPAGSAIVFSTYLGGSDTDNGDGVAIDSSGATYVTGRTLSTDFPLVNPIQGTSGGAEDAFVTKIDLMTKTVAYSTYLGGSLGEEGFGIAVDSAGAAYITGPTGSSDFPIMNPLQATPGGGNNDAFVTKINPAGTALRYSTYLGGSSWDIAYAIALDSTGAVYITGKTWSLDFPLVTPIQGIFGGIEDAFVVKINPAGSSILYSTYLGGSNSDMGWSIAVDSLANAYVTGDTLSTDFPLVNAIQGVKAGFNDAFVTRINPAGTALVYSSYLGGDLEDYGTDIAMDGSGNIYVSGKTLSKNFPLVNPFQGSKIGLIDAFVTKIGGDIDLSLTPDTKTVPRGGTMGYVVTVTNNTALTQCFDYWEDLTLPDGATYPPTGTIFGPVHPCLSRASGSAHLTHFVPMSAPLGTYILHSYTGTYSTVDRTASFSIDITP